jgi:hypothetical protein
MACIVSWYVRHAWPLHRTSWSLIRNQQVIKTPYHTPLKSSVDRAPGARWTAYVLSSPAPVEDSVSKVGGKDSQANISAHQDNKIPCRRIPGRILAGSRLRLDRVLGVRKGHGHRKRSLRIVGSSPRPFLSVSIRCSIPIALLFCNLP